MPNQHDNDLPTPETNAYAPPTASPEVHKAPREITKAQRLAGMCLVFAAGLTFAQKVVESRLRPAEDFSNLFQNSPYAYLIWMPIIVPLVIVALDLVLGLLLVAKKQRAVPWAVIRVVLGLILIGLAQAYYLRQSALDSRWLLLVFVPDIALLILLTGSTAQKLRLIVGGIGFGLCGLVNLWNLGVAATGIDPLGGAVETAKGNIEPESIEEVTGRAVPYKLKFPPNKWQLN